MFPSDRVQFEKPNLEELTRDFTVVDLHFHSHYSDGLNGIEKIAAHARQLGIGIAITDHNEIRGAVEIDRYDDILSIPGIELTASEGSHILLYFYNVKQLQNFYQHHVKPFMGPGVMSSLSLSLMQIIERAKPYKCLIIFAHPYCAMFTGVCNLQFSRDQLHQLFDMAHGVEVLNASNLKKWNLKCTVLGFNLDKVMVGGSDGHALCHMGRTISYARCARTRRDFLDALCQKTSRVIGKEIDLFSKMTANGLKLRSNLSNCPDIIEKNIRYGCKALNYRGRLLRENMQRKFGLRLKTHPFRDDFDL